MLSAFQNPQCERRWCLEHVHCSVRDGGMGQAREPRIAMPWILHPMISDLPPLFWRKAETMRLHFVAAYRPRPLESKGWEEVFPERPSLGEWDLRKLLATRRAKRKHKRKCRRQTLLMEPPRAVAAQH